MNLHALKQSIYSDLWAVLPNDLLALRAAVNDLIKKADMEMPAAYPMPEDDDATADGNVAVIDVCGMIVKGFDPLVCALFGLCDLDCLAEEIRDVGNNPNISTVIFNFNSPGGMTLGVYETSEMIRVLGKSKRTIAYSSGLFASAAYWLGSACNEIYVSPTSVVGSVGVSCIRYDETAANEAEGIKTEFFATSPRKFWGNPDYPITDDERESIQADIERTAEHFYSSVKQNRTIAKTLLDQAVVVDGFAAVDDGFADGIYNTLFDLEDQNT